MNSSDFRKEAREKLSGKWGKAALITFIYCCFTFILIFFSNVSGFLLLNILAFVITIVISYGLTDNFIKLYDNIDVSPFDFISTGFNNFSRSCKIILNILPKLLLPIILLIISVLIISMGGLRAIISALVIMSPNPIDPHLEIINIGLILLVVSNVLLIFLSYNYQLSLILAIENPDLTAKEAIEKSKEYMNGNKWKLFCLHLSFLGWFCLIPFTFGIGFIVFIPYIKVATIAFSRYVCGKKEDTTTQTENIENNDNN